MVCMVSIRLDDTLIEAGLFKSRSEFRRLVEQGGIRATLPNGKSWIIKDNCAFLWGLNIVERTNGR